jgi:hypothetical protein
MKRGCCARRFIIRESEKQRLNYNFSYKKKIIWRRIHYIKTGKKTQNRELSFKCIAYNTRTD